MGDDAGQALDSPQDDGKEGSESGFDGTGEDMGDPEEIERLFTQFGRHEEVKASPSEAIEEAAFEEALELAIEQMKFFDSPSLNITGVNEHSHKDMTGSWGSTSMYGGREGLSISEGVMSTALQRLRILFADNACGRTDRNLRSGKVDSRSLARRAPTGDDRLFKKRTIPGRRD